MLEVDIAHRKDLFTDIHWINRSEYVLVEFVTAMAWDSCHKSNFESLTYSSDRKKNEKIQWVLASFKNNPITHKEKDAKAKPDCA